MIRPLAILLCLLAAPNNSPGATLERAAGQIGPWAAVAAVAPADVRSAPWTALVARATASAPALRLEVVNRGVNGAAGYVAAPPVGPQGDRWEAPAELLVRGGACRDFAVAKFFVLRAAGVADDDLRLEVLMDEGSHQWHAIVDAKVGGRWYALDSRYDVVLPREALTRYRPVYLMNEAAWWYWRRG